MWHRVVGWVVPDFAKDGRDVLIFAQRHGTTYQKSRILNNTAITAEYLVTQFVAVKVITAELHLSGSIGTASHPDM